MTARRAYLGLGSNLGDRAAHLQFAVDGLAARAGAVLAVSPVYETEPVGGPPQPGLLDVAKALEREAGRDLDGGPRWSPRPLDIDILLLGDVRLSEPDLVVPHPRISQRAFVLAPLADLAPELVVAPSAGWQGVRRNALQLVIPE
jgi:2-amino-4-hydroxy-6-hydroxymethyldihydropteridine diphosphokinase